MIKDCLFRIISLFFVATILCCKNEKKIPRAIEINNIKIEKPNLKYGLDFNKFSSKEYKIKKGDTICLIEAMKTFNEIKSDKDGVVKSILIKNGEAVEFGQPLFEIS